ncbi:NuA4 histone acetyltransferase subunit [Malassezia vespertilionis]|uniref:Arp4p n=1 Tax=Malassezia vespertilionis TaxID=2020962 RepID=A0A2N1JGD3_9BASI|nr:NuA4 histone acetyltransferase subunit [Malassezia vespertilionis]PKI85603.1 Arp4p [Malassezia vespertilionis]WFD04681.1 NuA4 histone acetyltransferase subunit [Malassezia vespertilionis]
MSGVYGGDEINAVVIDPGTSVIRGGWAGDDQPRALFPAHYGWLPMREEDGVLADELASAKRTRPAEDGDISMQDAAKEDTEQEGSEKKGPKLCKGISFDTQRGRKRFVGDAGVSYWRNGLEIATPFDSDGIVQDFDAFEALTRYATETLAAPSTENPLLLTEPSTNPKEVRAKMAEVAFEGLQVPAFYLANRTVLSSFAAGRPTALVVDVGASQLSAIPVVDGFVLRKGIHTQSNAGDTISRALLHGFTHECGEKNLKEDELIPQFLVKSKQPVDPGMPPNAVLREDRLHGTTPSFRMYQTMQLLSDAKEAVCQVLETPWDEGQAGARPTKMYEFPNGYNDTFSLLRFKAPEVMFTPSLYGQVRDVLSPGSASASPLAGLTDLILDAAKSVDVDLRAAMFSNIVCVGGSTLIPGFIDRLSYELSVAAPSQRIKIHSPGNYTERRHSSWLGGSILASLGTFHQLWISRQEYEEHGSAIVQARCK